MNILNEFGQCRCRPHDIRVISRTLEPTQLTGHDNYIYFIYPVDGEFVKYLKFPIIFVNIIHK